MFTQGAVIQGEYRILDKIAQGEIGEVYKVVLRGSEELRALKVMKAGLMDDELLVQRFKQEAAQARNFLHANAARVEGIGETEDGRPFLVMEYIPGQSLKDLIEKEGRLPVARVCSLVKQVASVLDAAHHLGIVHQDVKPGNVMVVEKPQGEQVKVLDCGVARIKEVRRRDMGRIMLKGMGILMGTPQYFSPEQAVGKRGDDLDGRSDLYSLGVVMYEMLTAHFPFPPFKANATMKILLAHLLTPPTPIAQLDSEGRIPNDIANLVMQMLEKKRELRPASAKAVIEELERWEKREATESLSSESGVQSQETGFRPWTPEAGLKSDESLSSESGVQTQEAGFQLQTLDAGLKDRRWLLPLLTAMVAIGLGGGALYFSGRRSAFSRPSPSGPPTLPAASSSPMPSPAIPQGQEPGTGNSGSAPSRPGQVTLTRPPKSVTSPSGSPGGRTKSESKDLLGTKPAASKPSVDPRKVESAITEGDRFFRGGEYDRAIRAYESGLILDPANKKLRTKIGRANSAKAAEAKYLNE